MDRKRQIFLAVFIFLVVAVVITDVVVYQISNQPDAIPWGDFHVPLNLDRATGTEEFMAKWKTWMYLPESEKRDWLAEPEFNWERDYFKLVELSDSGLSTVSFEKWVRDGWTSENRKKRVPISEYEINYLRTEAAMFDCRLFTLNDELRVAIQKAQRLTYLRLSDDFDEKDLDWLTDLKRLKGLSLDGIAFNNGDMRPLAKLSKLKWLELYCASGNKVVLPRLLDLEVLRMTGRGITDQQLPVQDQFPRLKFLDVSGSKVTDNGMLQIARNCSRLKYLNLSWCSRISYKSVESLEQLVELRFLDVNGTPLEHEVSGSRYQTIPELQIKLPKCHIRIGER